MAILPYTDIEKVRLYIMDGSVSDPAEVRAFSDDELETFLSWNSGSIKNTSLYCLDRLIIQAAKRFDYSQGETKVMYSKVVAQMQSQRDRIAEAVDVDDPTGGMVIAKVETNVFDNLKGSGDTLMSADKILSAE